MARPTELIVNPCTPGDLAHNAQVTQELITNIITIIDGSSTIDDKKLAVNLDDYNNATYDYLHAKVEQTDVADATLGYATVRSETVDDLTELFYVDFSLVSNYGGSLKYLAIDGGELFWLDGLGVTDSYTVKSTATDTVAGYLHDAIEDNATYASGADIIVAAATGSGAPWAAGTGAADQTERLFVDVSAISGYHATNLLVLTIEANAVSWQSPTDIVGAGYAIDIDGSFNIGFDPTELTGFTSQFQFFGHLASAASATDPLWTTVSSYDAAANQMWWHQSGTFAFKTTSGYDITKTQALVHINGAWAWKTIAELLNLLEGYSAGSKQIIGHDAGGDTQWKTLVSKVLNNPTNIQLNLSSTHLTSVLDYVPVTVYLWPEAEDGVAADFDDSVTVDDCE